ERCVRRAAQLPVVMPPPTSIAHKAHHACRSTGATDACVNAVPEHEMRRTHMLHELPMVFTSDGVPLAGTFVRNSASLSARQRCVVVTGSWLNVKEQMALVYARALAERGFTAFTYD